MQLCQKSFPFKFNLSSMIELFFGTISMENNELYFWTISDLDCRWNDWSGCHYCNLDQLSTKPISYRKIHAMLPARLPGCIPTRTGENALGNNWHRLYRIGLVGIKPVTCRSWGLPLVDHQFRPTHEKQKYQSFEPGAAGWKALTNPMCCALSPMWKSLIIYRWHCNCLNCLPFWHSKSIWTLRKFSTHFSAAINNEIPSD